MDIRSKFLEFFKSKGHQVYASMPLVPDDPTLLFTNSGMVQFKDIFTGKIPTPAIPRATSSQLCIRAGGKHNDLENVGFTRRHHTLFEMLGNFSFGDYFKEQAIAYAWEFVTEVLGFDKSVLYVTIHTSDDEAFEIWQKHISKERIKRLGDKDNFWQMGDTGACGPCSEIFVDQGESFDGEEDYFGGDGDRFLEIWNLVFMQYERHADGSLTPLPKPSIDTGMGLERVSALLENKRSNFDSSIFMPLIREVEILANQPYVYDEGASFRVIADHARSVTFLLAQGVNFDKEGRGYVLRRILRRAVRHGYLLGINEPFLYKITQKVCEQMGAFYPYLNEKKALIAKQCQMEEARFFETIESGISLFNQQLEIMEKSHQKIFSGEVAFKLYDTFGFPLDITEDMLKEKGLSLDLEGFNKAMDAQKALAKASWKGSGDAIKEGDFKTILSEFSQNAFIGYEHDASKAKILCLFNEDFKRVQALHQENGYVLLDQTPFYPESGGAVGDCGEIRSAEGALLAKVVDTQKYFDLNISTLQSATLQENQEVKVVVDASRSEIAKHHSATHLLHAVLREVLGESVAQAGSLVERDRLRFDFSFLRAVKPEELAIIQDRVNDLIYQANVAEIEHMDLDSARNKGAMALFGQKYGEVVRVVSFGKESCELCGGIHVKNTSHISHFIITKESGVSSGVRRIEAVCGKAAYEYTKNLIQEKEEAKALLKSPHLLSAIAKLKEQNKQLEAALRSKQSQVLLESVQIHGAHLIVQAMEGEIKAVIDEYKNRYEKIAILLINQDLQIAAGCKNVSINAGEWVRETAKIMGGNGGGRGDFATAGGREEHNKQKALDFALDFAKEKLAKS